MTLHYLTLDRSETDDGLVVLEALASTREEQHAHALAEVQQVLDWAAQRFPHSRGPVEDGGDWDHDLQVHEEAGGWRTVTLTLAASPAFAAAFEAAFLIDEGR